MSRRAALTLALLAALPACGSSDTPTNVVQHVGSHELPHPDHRAEATDPTAHLAEALAAADAAALRTSRRRAARDSRTRSTITARTGAVERGGCTLAYIRAHESGGNYRAVNPNGHSARHAATYALDFQEPPPPLRIVGGAPAPARPGRKLVTPPDHVAGDSHRAHGTRVKYVIERCRCEPCRAANREASRARQKAIQRPDQAWVPYVPAGPARRHCHALMAQGVGPKSIAKLSGVPHGAISKLLYGDYVRGTKPSKRIRPDTARRILAVTVDHAAGAQKIDASETWRMLDELIARGWTKTYLAQRLGQNGPGLQVKRTLVRASTARKVEHLHSELADQTPPPRRSRWTK